MNYLSKRKVELIVSTISGKKRVTTQTHINKTMRSEMRKLLVGPLIALKIS